LGSGFFRFPSDSHGGQYATLAEAYVDDGRYEQARQVTQTVVRRVATLDASTLNDWLRHARLLEDGLPAPTQAIRVYARLASSELPADLKTRSSPCRARPSNAVPC
jgi:hypothetical protein